jgi:hypothetical protein
MSDDFVEFTNVVNSDILSYTTLKSGAGYVFKKVSEREGAQLSWLK